MIPYTLAQLRTAHFPEPLPIVEGLLNEGETILLVGRPKVGKSRLTQQMTLDLSRGQPFLGHFTIRRPRRVAVLDLENRPNVVRARFASMSLPDAGDEMVCICAAETLAEDSVNASPPGMKLLETFLKHANADVLIIDTWRLFAGGDENDAAAVVAALKALSTIRQNRPQLGIILVHHLRKERTNGRVRLREDPFTWVESVSGHHALVGHVDACYGLEREIDGKGDELIVFGGVARNAATSTLLLEEDDQTLLFSVRSGLDAAVATMTPAELDLWNCADKLKKFAFTELVKEAGTKNKKAVGKMLRKAQDHGILQKNGALYVVV
jgi:hypothetical protein